MADASISGWKGSSRLEKKLHIGFPGGSPSPKRNKGIIPKILQVQGCIGCLGEFRTAPAALKDTRRVFWRGFFVWAGLETTAKSTSPFSRAVRASGVE